VKDNDTVIKEFNELVNMSPDQLKEWLGGEDSAGAGWSKDDGSGETIGHESKYDEEDISHMRKVVAYNKRHLAQEGKAKQDPESKSAKSLKNWGHDPQQA
ncbi:hypothetical protein KCU71_g19148, partial [Aureobasidium melanogenum]